MGFLPGMGSGGGLLGSGNILIGAETRGIRGQVRKAMGDVRDELNTGAANVERTSSRWNAAFGVIGMAAKAGMLGIVAAVGAGIGAAIQFESAWAGVRKTVDATPQELEALRQSFRDLAKEIPVSVNELAAIGETAGAMGIAKEGLLEFVKTVALIGQTTNVTTDAAATALGQLSNVLHLTQDDYGRFAATLVDLGNKGASTESQILDIASRVGSAAGLMGISAKDVLAYSSAIASLGIEVEAGGTSLQSFFLKTNKVVGQGAALVDLAKKAKVPYAELKAAIDGGGKGLKAAADATGLTTKKLKELSAASTQLDLLARVAGMTGEQFKQAFEQDAAKALAVFLEGLGKLKGAEQQGVLTDLKMSDVRITRTLLGLANGAGLLATNLDNATNAWQADTAATDEAAKRFETTASQLGLLKNLIQDYLITLGDAALPAVKGLLTLLRDTLPKAVTFLVGIWGRILAPALGRLGDAFGHLGEAVGRLFGSGDKATSWSGVAKTAFTGIASAVAGVADGLARIVDAISWLLKNPIGGMVAKLLLAAGAIKLVTSGSAALIRSLQGASGSVLRGIGLGGLAGPAAGQGTIGDQATVKAAGRLSGAAGQLEGAAGALRQAGTGLKAGAAANAFGTSFAPGLTNMPQKGQTTDLFFRQDPNLRQFPDIAPGITYDQSQSRGGGIVAVDRAAKDFYVKNRRQLEALGAGTIKETAARIMDGAVSAGRNIRQTVGGLASGALSLAGKAFWPIMLAGIATEVLKAPIGSWVASNTGFKRVGAKIKEDFFGDLLSWVEAAQVGSDLFTVLPKVRIGKTTVDTKSLRGFDLTDQQVADLQGGGLKGALTGSAIAPEVLTKIQRSAGEDVRDWFKRVRQSLVDSGIDVTAMDAALKDAGDKFVRMQTPDMIAKRAAGMAALTSRLQAVVSGYVSDGLTNASQSVNDAILSALQQVAPNLTHDQLINIPTSAYDAIAKVLLQSADLDPNVLAVAVGRAAKTPPKVTPTLQGDMETRRGQDHDLVQAYTKVKEGLDAAAKRLTDSINNLTPERQQALTDYTNAKTESGDPAHTKEQIADFEKQLRAAQAGVRETNLSVLGFLQESTKGLETLTGSKQHQAAQTKARQAVLDQINAMLTADGQQPIDWTQLIDWQKSLSESTGETARLQLATKMKEWSVNAARQGSKEGAATFQNAWATDIAQAKWDDTATALRAKLNGLIPGKASDVSKAKFTAWLKDAQSGDFTPEQLRTKLNKLIPGTADDLSKGRFGKWFKDVTTFGEVDGAAMEALRKKINGLIPGTADDISKAKFAAWLKDVTTQGVASDPFPGKTADDFVGDVSTKMWPGKARDDDVQKAKNYLFGTVTEGTTDAISLAGPALVASGQSIIYQIARGIRSDASVGALQGAMSFALAEGVKGHVPGSPVKRGALKHPFLHEAGANIMRQLQGGMKAYPLALPTGAFGPTLKGARVASPGMPQGRKVDIHADKLQVFTQADERSISARFDFLTQEGR